MTETKTTTLPVYTSKSIKDACWTYWNEFDGDFKAIYDDSLEWASMIVYSLEHGACSREFTVQDDECEAFVLWFTAEGFGVQPIR